MNNTSVRTLRGHESIKITAEVFDGDPHNQRPSVFMLHGGGQNRHAWTNTARALSDHGNTVVTIDTRGHGDSEWDPTGNYETDDLTHDLLAIHTQMSRGRPVVAVGASMGGMTILNAHRHAPPDLWAGVVLVDVTPRMEIAGAQRVVAFMAAHPDGFASLQEASDVIAAYNPHRPRPTNLDGLLKVLRRRDDDRYVWRWDPAFITSKTDAMNQHTNGSTHRYEEIANQLLEGAACITAPTLLVRGAMSDLVSPDTVEEFLATVPHATAIDVSNTGHMVAGDDNDAFTTAVLDFLNQLDPIN
ncbi:MAG: alpha/beta hydrolase [Ilumatobacteraceae bacterium]|nr:alpha/beta hydrolase [Ilumatobacteraceae bacterium]